jgi:ribonuclease-3
MTSPLATGHLLRALGLEREPAQLHEALTHASYVNEHPGARDYERLEFLGDAVLGLCVSELLLQSLPRASEGRLTRMRAALVNTEALADFARSIGLGGFVRLGRGAAADALQAKVLADVVEALVAAVYLDGGVQAARELTLRIIGDVGVRAARLAARDPKSRLQELVQGSGRSAPVYRTVLVEGPDHDRWFEVEVEVDGRRASEGEQLAGEGPGEPAPSDGTVDGAAPNEGRITARGRGRTKKQAEREAAQRLLELESQEPEDTP